MFCKKIVILFLTLTSIFVLSGCQVSKVQENKTGDIINTSQVGNVTVNSTDRKEGSKSADYSDYSKWDLGDDIKTYTDKKFNFRVSYPKNWSTKIDSRYEATSEHEASPDEGINIYVRNKTDEKIYVYGQYGHISISEQGFRKEKFITKSGLTGYLLSRDSNEEKEIYLVLGEGFHGAYVKMSTEAFEQNEKLIIGVLRSIQLINYITVSNSDKISDDGSMVFNVTMNNDSIGSFFYKPWLENRPAYCKLNNGNIILGKSSMLDIKQKKIVSLIPGMDIGVFDYDVRDGMLAVIGKQGNEDATIGIYLINLSDGSRTLVDNFKYPDFQYQESVFLGWGKDGLLYYDYCDNQKPAIKMYDINTKKADIYMASAMNPQLSKDGEKMVLVSLKSFNKIDRDSSELQLINIKSKEKLAKLNGSNKIFWSTDYLFVRNVDQSKLEVYDLKSKGQKVKDLTCDEMPFDVSVDSGKVVVKSYNFKDSKITLSNKEFTF